MTTSLTTAQDAGYGHPGRLLEALAHQDFVMLADALEGDGRRVVEQQAYVTCPESGHIGRSDLLCTGYIPVGKELLP
jgi:hypothetical protein